MDYAELMVKFGELLGVEGLVPDDNGLCRLSVDGTVVSFVENPERGCLDIYARICDQPAEDVGKVLKELMTAMAPGSAAENYSFFLVEEDNGIYLRRTERLIDLDVEAMCQSLEKFANAVDEWRAAISDYQSILPDVNAALRSDEEAIRAFGLDGRNFMQV